MNHALHGERRRNRVAPMAVLQADVTRTFLGEGASPRDRPLIASARGRRMAPDERAAAHPHARE